ncbi:MAG: SDR family oxidoreductase [Ardenticatenaceae bacterium]|nr:SDR family oxidoreductase [Ardenticatenaceae bacterium]
MGRPRGRGHGGSPGLGRGTALRLAAEGAHVVVADLQPKVMDVWAEMQERFPVNQGYAATVDVTSAEAVNRLVDQVVEQLGRLDLMVNNAGVVQPMVSVAETPDEVFDRVIDVNLRGVFNGSRAAARVMREQHAGCIINLGSWYGKQGFANFGVYCASKAAVIRLTESLALELAPYGVRANSICPGNMATEMHWRALRDEAQLRGITFEEMDHLVKQSIPLGRQGTPDDIGAAVVFLASADGAYITGEALNVNGGCLFH